MCVSVLRAQVQGHLHLTVRDASLNRMVQMFINHIRANFKICTVHSMANLKVAVHRRNHYSSVLALCGTFPAEKGKTMWGMFDAVSEKLVMVSIYCCMCRGSLPVVEDETALICANINGSSGATKRQEKQAKTGPPTAVVPQWKAVCSNACSKRKRFVNRANFYDEFTRHLCLKS